ncbi:YaaL family protein [Anaerosinus massiliensis]|uniref:YaaL family protein n=1 Tax=Massilibacillus massiliensis TaxID=1806837 RepID=UPI000DA5EDC1|nr:YaaL family protein [Massilibacillus massiliensis]
MNLDGILSKLKSFSYLHSSSNILWYKHVYGGDYLINLYTQRHERLEHEKAQELRREFLHLLEKAKLDWQYSMKMLAEITDVDLMDYVIYLIKANEAKYRYLLKIARQEKIQCDVWQKNNFHDIS